MYDLDCTISAVAWNAVLQVVPAETRHEVQRAGRQAHDDRALAHELGIQSLQVKLAGALQADAGHHTTHQHKL